MRRTISGMIGTGSLAHNRRDFITENVDPDRVHLNILNNPVPVSLLSVDRKPQIRFLGNHPSGSGNLYHKSFRM